MQLNWIGLAGYMHAKLPSMSIARSRDNEPLRLLLR